VKLGVSRHETAWMMLHKLRRAMVAPEREPLKDEVEVDELFLGGFEEGRIGGRKRTDGKALVGVAIEVQGRGSGRVRLQVLTDASADSLGSFVKATTTPGAIVHTDGWKGYNGLRRLGYEHRRRAQHTVAPGRAALTTRAPRRLKPQGMAARHPSPRLKSGPPAYLDEFVFRHNRRNNPQAAFQTLLGLSTRHQPSTYRRSSIKPPDEK
jgi:transposase-like protein